MFSEYIQAALNLAVYELIDNDEYCATVPKLRGVIAIGKTVEECRSDLIEVIEEWIALRLSLGMVIPSIGGQSIQISKGQEVVF